MADETAHSQVDASTQSDSTCETTYHLELQVRENTSKWVTEHFTKQACTHTRTPHMSSHERDWPKKQAPLNQQGARDTEWKKAVKQGLSSNSLDMSLRQDTDKKDAQVNSQVKCGSSHRAAQNLSSRTLAHEVRHSKGQPVAALLVMYLTWTKPEHRRGRGKVFADGRTWTHTVVVRNRPATRSTKPAFRITTRWCEHWPCWSPTFRKCNLSQRGCLAELCKTLL